MKIISLGWGVQSWTLAAMAALGEIEADVAIHADTTWEKAATYAFRQQWEPWLQERGLRVAVNLGRSAIGIELNPEYAALAERLLAQTQPALIGV